MKILIHKVPEASGSTYELWAEIAPVVNPEEHYQLTFSSVWTGAKDPEAPQIKGQFLLSPEAIDNLRDLLDSQ